jgi:hypothetical protein
MGEEAGMDEFDYFMVRVRRATVGQRGGPLAGVAERLGTGEKWTFENSDELLRVVCGLRDHRSNMLAVPVTHKPPDS